MRTKWPFLFLFCQLFTGLSANAQSRTEVLGELKIKELLLEPTFVSSETEPGGFSMGSSQLAIQWQYQSDISAHLRLGQNQLLNRPRYYNAPAGDDHHWSAVEAYGEWESRLGTFRMGLLPLNYSVEGEMGESELYFTRSLIFEERLVALRDFGFQYTIAHRGFFTSMTVHNGEAGEAVDRRTWFTAKWGWQDREKFWVGFSGQTGGTESVATNTSTETLGSADLTKDAKWRMGSFFLRWHPSDFQLFLELHKGEVEQEKSLAGRFLAGHFDLLWKVNPNWGLQARYDYLEPDSMTTNNVQKKASLGVSLSNKTRTSELFLIATKNIEEVDVANDELRLMWRLTPLYSSP